MSAPGGMAQSALIRRQVATGQNAYGGAATEERLVDARQPCRAWTGRVSEMDASGKLYTVDYERGMFPLDSDIKHNDAVTVDGRTFIVDTVLRRRGYLEVRGVSTE